MLLSSGYSLIVKSVEITFGSYYFVKLFGHINSRKSILQNHNFLVFFFVKEGNLLCCTRIKVTSLFSNKVINFSNDCNKPPVIKYFHHTIE